MTDEKMASFRAKPGNLVETILSSSPRHGYFCCLGIAPRGLSGAVIQATLPRDERAALRLLNMTVKIAFAAENQKQLNFTGNYFIDSFCRGGRRRAFEKSYFPARAFGKRGYPAVVDGHVAAAT